MSTAGQRRSLRVVLVIPRAEPVPRLGAALDDIARQGWTVSAIIDPTQHLDALRMVLKGLADVVVAVDPDHLPSLKIVSDLPHTAGGPRGGRRTRIIRRGDAEVELDDLGQAHVMKRPQRVERPVEQPNLPEPAASSAAPSETVDALQSSIPPPVAESRVQIPASRRASQSHRSGIPHRRTRIIRRETA